MIATTKRMRLLSFVLCLVLCLSLLPFTAAAADKQIDLAVVYGLRYPVAGETAAENLADVSVPSGNGYTLASAMWWVSSDNYTWSVMGSSEVFTVGKYYYYSVFLKPDDGYVFPSTGSGSTWRIYTGTVEATDLTYATSSVYFGSTQYLQLDICGKQFQLSPVTISAGDPDTGGNVSLKTTVPADWTSWTYTIYRNTTDSVDGAELVYKVPVTNTKQTASFAIGGKSWDTATQVYYFYVEANNGTENYTSNILAINNPKYIQDPTITGVVVNGLTKPVVGQTVADNLKNVEVPAEAIYTLYKVNWYESSTSKDPETSADWTAMSDDDVFKANKFYLYSIWLKPETGCAFPCTTAGAYSGNIEIGLGVLDKFVCVEKENVYYQMLHISGNIINAVSPTGFTDVPAGCYYEDAVNWAVDLGITNGTSPTTFSPNADCTRGQIVTFLWRLYGSPEPTSTTCSFTDVPTSSYYYKAILWAVEKGITNGTSPTTFSPNAACTRGQAVTFLWRAAGKPAASGSTGTFTDVPSGEYYAEAVQWAVGKGITNGTSPTTFSPNVKCTRAHIVTFLYRYMNNPD